MTWFKIDDDFFFHPKVIAAGNSAIGLFVRCGSWASNHLTDGHIPDKVIEMFGCDADITRLIEVELLEETDTGYFMPAFLDYNPSAEEVRATRAASAERQRQSRTRRSDDSEDVTRDSRVSHNDVTRDSRVSHSAPTRPDPDKTPPPRTPVDNSVRKVVVAASKRILQAAPPGITPRNRSAYLAGMQARLTADHDDLEQLIARDGPEIAIQQLVDRELGIEPTDTGPPPLRHDPDCPHCDGSGWRSLDELTVDRCDCTPPALATVTELRAPA